MMETTCTNCGKKYQQSHHLPALCMQCTLIKLTSNENESELALLEYKLDLAYEEASAEDYQRQIDAELEAEEEAEREEQDFWDSFSYLWYKLVGWSNYNKFVAPVLIRVLRFKKRWSR